MDLNSVSFSALLLEGQFARKKIRSGVNGGLEKVGPHPDLLNLRKWTDLETESLQMELS